jgi:3-methyladenine DNA glycosylase/8-oxoguanine DNA glycosylase
VTAALTLHLPARYDLAASLSPLALGGSDPTTRISASEAWWASRTPDGPGTLRLRRAGQDRLAVDVYGDGADWLLARAEAIAGLRDDLTGFADLARAHPLVHRLAREHSGLRLPATGRVFQAVLPAIIGQKVTGLEAKRAYAGIVRHFGAGAPGPEGGRSGLYAPPDPAALADAPYYVYHRFGVEQRRADTLRRAAREADPLERAPDAATATRRLTSIAGIGPWTSAETTRVAYGDPDQVSVGDYHLPHIVSWALAGQARSDDARMLELLAPFAGHRGRVCQLIMIAGFVAPRFGPRMPIRSFARF